MPEVKKIPNEYGFRNQLTLEMNSGLRNEWASQTISSIAALRNKLTMFSPCNKWEVIMNLSFSDILETAHMVGSEWKTTFTKSDRKSPFVADTIGAVLEETMESAFLGDKSDAVLPFSIRPLLSKDAKVTGLDRCKTQVISIRICTSDYDWLTIPVAYLAFDTEECGITKEHSCQRETGGRITGYRILNMEMAEIPQITIGELLDFARCRTVTLARLQMKETLSFINQMATQNFVEMRGIASMQAVAEDICKQTELLRDSIVALNSKKYPQSNKKPSAFTKKDDYHE